MRLYSYVVRYDYGFAPNPFHGWCTVATCKPEIRAHAAVGDWIMGTGGTDNGLVGKLVFAMRVTETATFTEYFSDARFQSKKPDLRGSLKQAFGDNIYRRHRGRWQQLDSHHSLATGAPNPANIEHDTRVDRVLLSDDYVYFGAAAIPIPPEAATLDGTTVLAVRGHKCRFPETLVRQVVSWIEAIPHRGLAGRPAGW